MMNSKKVLITLLLSLTMVVTMAFSAYAADYSRISGSDRYETSVKICQSHWSQANTVYLTSGESFADALAITPDAIYFNIPILYTEANQIPTSVMNEIKRLGANNIVLVGGTGVISADLENSLKSQGYHTSRYSGQDRYETAVKVAQDFIDSHSSGIDNTRIFLTTGSQFQYAMAASSYIEKIMTVTLFTDGDSLNPTTKAFIAKSGLKNVTILGGDSIVSSNVDTELKNMGLTVTRIGGNTPQEFNANAIKALGTDANVETLQGIAIASDSTFADSLCGSVVAAQNNLAITLVGNSFDYVVDKNKVNKVLIFGGTGAVSAEVENSLKSLIADDSQNRFAMTAKDTDPLPINDASFKSQLNLSEDNGGNVKTVADAKQVHYLSLSNVSNLEGIQYFTNLKTLSLDHCYIKDLMFLSKFTNLDELSIFTNNGLQNLNGIENLTSLKVISISGCKNLTDISAVSNLKNLKFFSIDNENRNPIDISYVKGLTNLEQFITNGTYVKSEDVVGNLTKLTSLRMKNSDIKDASFVSNLPNLKELDLGNNYHLKTVGNLQNATNLQYFDIGMTPITDLSMIKNNYNLIEVGITEDAYNANPQIVQELKSRGVSVLH